MGEASAPSASICLPNPILYIIYIVEHKKGCVFQSLSVLVTEIDGVSNKAKSPNRFQMVWAFLMQQ